MSNQTKPVLKGDIDNLAKQFQVLFNNNPEKYQAFYNIDEISSALLVAAPHKILSPASCEDSYTLQALLNHRLELKRILRTIHKPTDLTANQAD